MIDRWQQLTPRRLLQAAIVVALLTMALKTAAWWVTGSVGLLSDALEAGVNLLGAGFALLMVVIASRPADPEHPYGHHKAEYFASGFEGLLIVIAALAIIAAAVQRLYTPQPLEQAGLGMALSVLSSALNGLLGWVMLRASRVHRSAALEADARHLFTDVWTSAGVLVGVAGVVLTGWSWLDPVVAIGVALNILREGGQLVWRAAQGLMDRALEPEWQTRIEEALAGFTRMQQGGALLRFDHVVTRQAGRRRFADLHMHLPAAWPLGRAAALRAEVEQALTHAVPGLRVSIQLLPTDVEVPALGDDEEAV